MPLEKNTIFRLPWSKNDNPIGWLEVTDICNLKCLGCYRQKLYGHKTLEAIKEEILFLKKWRNVDNLSIAGGEPLMYPDIMEVVSFAKQQGIKPIMLTNGLKLDRDTVVELKKAGLAGFTIHIDSNQGRPQWRDKNEVETNELRQHFADMIYDVGGLYVIFNSTVYPSTMQYIPEMVQWAQTEHRSRARPGLHLLPHCAAGRRDHLSNRRRDRRRAALELCQRSHARSQYHFLRGVRSHQATMCLNMKRRAIWAARGRSIRSSGWRARRSAPGSASSARSAPRRWRLAQNGHHWFTGRYLAYLGESKIGRKIFLTSFVDKTRARGAQGLLGEFAAPPAARVRSGVRAEHRHHSSAGHHAGRHRRHVRQLPGHDLLERRADQLVPHGRVSPVRRLCHRGQSRRKRGSAGALNARHPLKTHGKTSQALGEDL